MRRGFAITVLSFTVCSIVLAQATPAPHHYMLQATISRHAGTVTVKADAPDPLGDAVTAVSEEYGWAVDYEDPTYTGTDLAMRPSPRAGGSPYTVIAGGAFQSTYTETPHMWSSRAAELSVLEKIVSDYNASGNPGAFRGVALPDGNYDVVGVATRNSSGAQVAVAPILDTSVSIPSIPRSRTGTFRAILAALPAKVLFWPWGIEGGVPAPGASVTLGGSGSARDLLMQMLRPDEVWSLTYQPLPKGSEYIFAIRPTMRAAYNSFGQRHLIPVEPGQ